MKLLARRSRNSSNNLVHGDGSSLRDAFSHRFSINSVDSEGGSSTFLVEEATPKLTKVQVQQEQEQRSQPLRRSRQVHFDTQEHVIPNNDGNSSSSSSSSSLASSSCSCWYSRQENNDMKQETQYISKMVLQAAKEQQQQQQQQQQRQQPSSASTTTLPPLQQSWPLALKAAHRALASSSSSSSSSGPSVAFPACTAAPSIIGLDKWVVILSSKNRLQQQTKTSRQDLLVTLQQSGSLEQEEIAALCADKTRPARLYAAHVAAWWWAAQAQEDQRDS